ncbi:MAG: response regulator [Deltaproteobacteria bacterium]|nr:response regulator [Deltaproteobacteria bacterium]
MPGAALVQIGEEIVGPYVLANLSAGGALLSGGPPIIMGEKISVVLLLPGHHRMTVSGTVVREEKRDSGELVLGVGFGKLPADQEDKIQQAVLAQLEKPHAWKGPVVLIVDDSVLACRALERDLRAIGRHAVSVSTPLDALRWLEQPNVTFDLALVDLYLGRNSGLELLEYCAETFPKMRRALMSGIARSGQLEEALSMGRVHAILSKPWERSELASITQR